jgi:hypothetical protein
VRQDTGAVEVANVPTRVMMSAAAPISREEADFGLGHVGTAVSGTRIKQRPTA